jgi:hypothetical protein
VHHLVDRFGLPTEETPTPVTGSIADRQRISLSNPQDASEMVPVVVGQSRRFHRLDQDVGAV